jgi:endonuclease YncB( thermonuclease family)
MMRGHPSGRRRLSGNASSRKRRRPRRFGAAVRLFTMGVLIGSLLGVAGMRWSGTIAVPTNMPTINLAVMDSKEEIDCSLLKVVDGDTLRCGTTRVRLSAIDAPEMPGHCRPGRQCTPGDPYASADHLRSLIAGSAVSCRQIDTDHYGRAVALCSAGGRDLSCEQVRSRHAVIRYGSLSC